MNKHNLIVGSAAAIAGLTIGLVTDRVVTSKAPQFKPALTWISGACVGVGTTMLVAPILITKSQAAAILASH